MTRNGNDKAAITDVPTCGIVMPISAIDGCNEEHWKDVLAIISEAVRLANYEPNLVSNDTDVGVIHKRIVQNLYNNPIVICDVSGKNPNVMFELGMRLAFDKPVVIVKDDKTPYSFDTAPVEHLTYPRDLRFGAIVEFKRRLVEKIAASVMHKNSFLSSFGTFKVAKIEEESAGAFEVLLEEMSSLKAAIARVEDRGRPPLNALATISTDDLLKRMSKPRGILPDREPTVTYSFVAMGDEESRSRLTGGLKAVSGFVEVQRVPHAPEQDRFVLRARGGVSLKDLVDSLMSIADRYKVKLDQISIDHSF